VLKGIGMQVSKINLFLENSFFMASLDAETHFTRAELFSSKIEG
jgi:hypothetical protein